MKLAVISDVHSNSWALRAVLQDAKERGANGFLFLGDLIGYLPDPRGTIQIFKQAVEKHRISQGLAVWIFGNHEELFREAIAARESWDLSDDEPALEGFKNKDIRRIELLQETIDKRLNKGIANNGVLDSMYKNIRALEGAEEYDWLCAQVTEGPEIFKQQLRQGKYEITLVHGGLNDSARYYVFPPWNNLDWDVRMAMVEPYRQGSYKPKKINLVLFGHTHIPTFCKVTNIGKEPEIEDVDFRYGEEMLLDGDLNLINPGSVGLPRDEDCRAAYAILDLKKSTIAYWRVDYEREELEKALIRYSGKINEYYSTAPMPSGPSEEYKHRLRKRRESLGKEQ